MVFWKIEFIDGALDNSYGYLVLTDELTAVGIYDLKGNPLTTGVSYSTVSGIDEPPSWAGDVK
jgi:hypothetical protein